MLLSDIHNYLSLFDRHLKLRPYIGMAGVTQVSLFAGQQEFGRGGLVNRMAIGTDDIGLCVRRAANIGARKILGVTSEASVQNLGGRHQ